MLQKPFQSAFTSTNPVLERWETAVGRILVIDDDSAVRRVLNRLFQLEGYTVDLAGDGIKGPKDVAIKEEAAIARIH